VGGEGVIWWNRGVGSAIQHGVTMYLRKSGNERSS
jgi:hypothetical protein